MSTNYNIRLERCNGKGPLINQTIAESPQGIPDALDEYDAELIKKLVPQGENATDYDVFIDESNVTERLNFILFKNQKQPLRVFCQPIITDSLAERIQKLKDPDPEMRKKAVRGLLYNFEAINPLIQTLKSDRAPEVRRQAAYVLSLLRDSESKNQTTKPLINALLTDPAAEVRIAAAAALQDQGESFSRVAARTAFRKVLVTDKVVEVRRQAASALAEDPQAVQLLIQTAKKDADASVRANALFSLGLMGAGKEAKNVLIGALSDTDENVQRKAAWSLSVSRDDQEVLTALFAIKNNPNTDPRVKQMIDKILKGEIH